MFSYVSAEERVPAKHRLWPIRGMIFAARGDMDGQLEKQCAQTGRPCIAPERLIRALLQQILHSIRRERLLVEELEYDVLFRWFVVLSVDGPLWDRSTVSKSRHRLLEPAIARELFEAILEQARMAGLLGNEHFSVDGTMSASWASHKRLRPKDGSGGGGGRNSGCDFGGEQRTNDTYASTTDPEVKLHKKECRGALEAGRRPAHGEPGPQWPGCRRAGDAGKWHRRTQRRDRHAQ